MKNLFLVLIASTAFFSCKDSNKEGVAEVNLEAQERQKTIDSMNLVLEKQRVIDSVVKATKQNEKQVVEKKEVVVVKEQAAAPQRKKWSGAAKGAVIGAGVGAVTGAAISKNKAEGAIIGGLAGAGVGAGTGAIIDDSKKN